MLIIIDGYNFIFTVPALEKHVEINRIEPMRNYIISLFSKYKEEKKYDITVVFDGNYTQTTLPKKQFYSGITVIYSKSGINADTEIKNITTLCQNPNDVYIVTYDNEIKRHVKRCGCHIIEPKAMYREILGILTNGEKNTSDEPEDKQKGPSEDDAKYWTDVFKNLPHKETPSFVVKRDIPKIQGKKTRYITIMGTSHVANTKAHLLMKHNIGFVSLEKPKKMNIKISVHWIYKCILTIGYASLIYYESSQDTSSVPLPSYSDKLIHFMVFGLLCLMICWTLSSVTVGNKGIYKIILAIGITSLFGVSDEFHQFFTPHRSVDIFDWVADTAGAVAAGFLWLAITNKLQMKGKLLNVGTTSYHEKE